MCCLCYAILVSVSLGAHRERLGEGWLRVTIVRGHAGDVHLAMSRRPERGNRALVQVLVWTLTVALAAGIAVRWVPMLEL